MSNLLSLPGTLWHRAASFLENGDLVLFAVVISVYHYWKALEPAGDPVYVAIPVALFVDLLHYRTVRRAVQARTLASVGIAALTTGMALGYHIVFYSLTVANHWHVWLYALPIPLGIGILAWHAAGKSIAEWRTELAAAQAEAHKATSKAEQAGSEVKRLRTELAQAKEVATTSGHDEVHECAYCDREFSSPQAVAAHKRFCEAYQEQELAQANGHTR